MAQRAVKQFAASIRLACNAFSISEKCYRYQAKLSSDNQQIADWLLRLTHNQFMGPQKNMLPHPHAKTTSNHVLT